MNQIIAERFDEVEVLLIDSPIVLAYEIRRRAISPADGKLRFRVHFVDGSLGEFFEYVTESEGVISVPKYSFHWQDKHGTLRRRWDNAPHHVDLLHAPHHVHESVRTVIGVHPPPDIFVVLRFIETTFGRQKPNE